MSDFARLLVIFLAAVNPAAVALAVQDRFATGATSPPAAKTVLIGAGAALALLATAVLAADPLLDFLDVAPETFRIAAGIVMATTGVFAAWRARVAAAPLEGDWRDGVFPLALPLLAGPAGLVAAMSYGLDEGRGLTFVAAAVVVTLASALCLAQTRRATRPLDALARIAGALLVVIAAGLIVEGVGDI